ncbi:ABC transporter substrate-binding protein [Gemmatimonadota bacterium]
MIRQELHPPAKMNRPSAGGVRAVLFALAVGMTSWACIPVGPPAAPPPSSGPVIPALEEGGMRGMELQEAALLLQEARSLLARGANQEALDSARTFMERFPRAPGSAEVLDVVSRASLALGRNREAAEAASLYMSALGPSHPFFPTAVVLKVRALEESGEPREALQNLLYLPPESPDSAVRPAREILRRLVGTFTTSELREITGAAPLTYPLRGVLATELAVALYLRGEPTEGERWARAALAGPLEPRETGLARGVLDGRLEEVLGRPVILGAILPRSGVSPGLLQYGEWVYEGIQLALEEFKGKTPRPVQLEVIDDRGLALGGRTSVRSLEGFGAWGSVGPLTQEVLAEAAGGRRGAFPIIAPFAFLPTEDAPGVLSMAGPDPGGARVVARYAWELGLEEVVVVRPATEEAGEDARAFLEEFQALGGVVPREIVYDSGGTSFQAQFEEVASSLPDGLFLPLDPVDIRVLAPQVTFYGLDTLGIQLLGTAGWTSDEVVMEVDSRHTDGVIASTTRISQDETLAFGEFRGRYEAFFQKTLRSQVPAFGYDAAALFLTALQSGPRNPDELLVALQDIRDFPGATGSLTVEEGRIARAPLLVRIQDHELIYISPRFD